MNPFMPCSRSRIVELLRSVAPSDSIALTFGSETSAVQRDEVTDSVRLLTPAAVVAGVEEPVLYTEPLALRLVLVSGVWQATVIRNRRGPVGLSGDLFATRCARPS